MKKNTQIDCVKFCFALLVGLVLLSDWALASDFTSFDKDSRLESLSKPTRCFFDAVAKYDERALGNCFSADIRVNIAGMRFNGPEETVRFAKRDIWGGKYKVEKVLRRSGDETVHCLFWPAGWSSPEPPIEYRFEFRNDKISIWFGKYR